MSRTQGSVCVTDRQLFECWCFQVKAGGSSNFIAGLKTAHLALKNRTNKSQRQRIVLFVGSPVDAPEGELVTLGKMLKKNSVAVDMVLFGDENAENESREKLMALLNAVNNQDNRCEFLS